MKCQPKWPAQRGSSVMLTSAVTGYITLNRPQTAEMASGIVKQAALMRRGVAEALCLSLEPPVSSAAILQT